MHFNWSINVCTQHVTTTARIATLQTIERLCKSSHLVQSHGYGLTESQWFVGKFDLNRRIEIESDFHLILIVRIKTKNISRIMNAVQCHSFKNCQRFVKMKKIRELKIDKEVKRSDSLWHSASGNVFRCASISRLYLCE